MATFCRVLSADKKHNKGHQRSEKRYFDILAHIRKLQKEYCMAKQKKGVSRETFFFIGTNRKQGKYLPVLLSVLSLQNIASI